MVQLSVALFAMAFLFGDLPQSDAVRDRLARAGMVSSGRGDSAPPSTTSTLPPPPPDAADLDQQLAAAGYPNVSATVLDRVVTLEGSVPDEASRGVVLRLARSTPGVDDVVDNTVVTLRGTTTNPDAAADQTSDDQTDGATTETAAIETPAVVIEATTSRVSLTGAVPDRAIADALLSAVQASYGADQIDGAVSIDADATVPVVVSVALATTRPELAEQLRQSFAALDEAQVQIDLAYEPLEPTPVEVEIAGLLDVSPIEFDVGSSAISSTSETTLDRVTEVLASFPDVAIEVGGHTDDTGSDLANRALSSQRAEAVVQALRDRGVENDLVAVGYGEARPLISPATTEAARAANRRTEFLVFER